ncbi:MAG: alpha-amylase/4-alpha-glucanotransferase domain-containing protein [candidate division Zixibacteria bacterium]|nr:alpha-amylase/4-alpha-glucanotransferase domain-containing protein [candidate division Zixibacteria bacterium]
MNKFKLAFGIHNHQPVGNFDFVFEDAHRSAYLPFLKLLKQYENIKISLHQSGILWDWQKTNHADYFQLVAQLIDNGQIEILTGGFYEPILSSIPGRDVIGQINKLSKYIKDHFEVESKGLWLTERIWEPHMPKLLSEAGVKFLPIDDTHFVYAGFEHAQLTGPFLTENEGHTVTLLPIQKKLRYLIPFGTVEEVINELKKQAEQNPNGCAVYADDGEKFGVWPNTYQHCYKDKWLINFFEELQKNSDWLEVVPLSVAANQKIIGRAYIPSASYAEMLHWSLPTQAFLEYESFEQTLKDYNLDERFGRFVRGGHWRGFLSKYEESNMMHKMMQLVSKKLIRFENEFPEKYNDANRARDRLFAGQCNCPYWHGVFGGIYLPHIRQAIWQTLLEANSELDQLLQTQSLSLNKTDFDIDGNDEIIVSNEKQMSIFKPAMGGSMILLASNEFKYNFTDTFTRRKEGYHLKLDKAILPNQAGTTNSIHDQVLAKESGLSDVLIEDWYGKNCFIDHFFASDVDINRFKSGRFGEEGDFILEQYDSDIDKKNGTLTLTRDGFLRRDNNMIQVSIKKKFDFRNSDIIKVSYELCTNSKEPVKVKFGIENNFNFQAGHAIDRYVKVNNNKHENGFLDSEIRYAECMNYSVIDEYRNLAVSFGGDNLSEMWQLPIFSVSLSEGGFEKVYQGTTLVNLFELELTNRPLKFDFSLFSGEISEIPKYLKKSTFVNKC